MHTLVIGQPCVNPTAGVLYSTVNLIAPIVAKFATTGSDACVAWLKIRHTLDDVVGRLGFQDWEVKIDESNNPPILVLEERKVCVRINMKKHGTVEFFSDQFLLGLLIDDADRQFFTIQHLPGSSAWMSSPQPILKEGQEL